MPQPKLTLYTRPDCPPCDWLKTWLRERDLAFEEHDVSTDKLAVFQLVRTYKSQSTPTLVIGDQVLIGFEPEKIEAVLNESARTLDPSPANQPK